MTITSLPTPPTRGDPENFAQRGDAFMAALPAFAGEANALQAEVNARQVIASAAAVTAAEMANSATSSAASGVASKNAAALSESAATAAKNVAESALDSFDDRWLGAKSSAPTLDNDGATIIVGALYWDTVLNGGCLRVRQGGAWVTIPANVAEAITTMPTGTLAATNVQAALTELDVEKANTASAALTGQAVIEGGDTDSKAQLSIKGATGSIKQKAKLRFYSTFGTDMGVYNPRHAASIISGFSAAWGTEYLDMLVNRTNNDAGLDSLQSRIVRVTIGGMDVSTGVLTEAGSRVWTAGTLTKVSQLANDNRFAGIVNPAFEGQVILPEGTAAVPALSFANDGSSDTGFYHISDGVFGISCNTVPVAKFSNAAPASFYTGVYTPSITTYGEGYRLKAGDASTGYGQFWRNDGSNYWLMLTANNDAGGVYNTLRPMQVTMATGDVSFGDGALVVTHGGAVRVASPALTDSTNRVATTGFVKGLNYAPLTASNTFVGGTQYSHSSTQTGYSTAGFQSRSASGDVYLALHAEGASAAAIRHTRGGDGISVVNGDNALAAVTASVFYGSNFVASGINSYRLKVSGDASGYGTFWRNDGNNLYLMLTALNNANGSYNDLRPFSIGLVDGRVSFGSGALVVTHLGVTTINNGQLVINNSGASADIKLVGTGSTPAKTLRANQGFLEVINDGYNSVIFSIADGGGIITTGNFVPRTDAAQVIGSSSQRWNTIYASSGTINTSDAREKTEVRSFAQNEVEAAKQLSKEIGAYKFLTIVAKKGDAAREHIGMTVQRAIEIMESNELDPFNYGFICYDEWAEETKDHSEVQAVEYQAAWIESTTTDEISHSEVLAVAYKAAWTEVTLTAGDRFSFRMDELLMFIARGFEARLAALETA